ncbi:hypothetical protein ACB263_20290, partial [Aeromonas sanarellii]
RTIPRSSYYLVFISNPPASSQTRQNQTIMRRILADFLSQSWFSAHASLVFHLPGYYGSLGNQKLIMTLPIKIMINFQS